MSSFARRILRHRVVVAIPLAAALLATTAFADKKDDGDYDRDHHHGRGHRGGYVVERTTVYGDPRPFWPAASSPQLVAAPFSDASVGRFDLGLSTGYNNPSGALGAELEVRLGTSLGVGVAVGVAGAGFRVTPQARLYPGGFAHTTAFFLEAGYSYNNGNLVDVHSAETGDTQRVLLAESSTANVAAGWRFQTGNQTFVALRLGWQFNLDPAWYSPVEGSDLDPTVEERVLGLYRPGGFTAGLAFGLAL
jgi:hypothetical protein